MEKLSMCRICLIQDVRMHCIINTYLEQTYEKLTAEPFETKDTRPIQVCYICCARLRNCYQLWASCIQSQKMFAQMLANPSLASKQIQNNNTLKILPPININFESETQNDNIDDELSSDSSEIAEDVQMKEENFEVDTVLEKVERVEMENNPQTTNLNKKYINTTAQAIHNTVEQKETTDASSEVNIYFKCNICDKRYRNKRYLIEHTRLHTGEKPYKCDICDETFSKKLSLNTHVRIHNIPLKIKLYRCHICNISFTQKGRLNRHVRVHIDERQYQCDICKKHFRLWSDLMKHLHTHSSGD